MDLKNVTLRLSERNLQAEISIWVVLFKTKVGWERELIVSEAEDNTVVCMSMGWTRS